MLDQVDFSLETGKITALMGQSGCGKSTLAKILLLLEKPDQGEILFDGKTVNRKNREEVLAFRRKSSTCPSVQSRFLIRCTNWEPVSWKQPEFIIWTKKKQKAV